MLSIYYVIVATVIGLIIMKVDKVRAIKQEWRIPENQLFLVAMFGGSLGVYMGMKVFRHKTKQPRFTVGIPLIMIAQIIALLVFLR